jgi:hypothetical protein
MEKYLRLQKFYKNFSNLNVDQIIPLEGVGVVGNIVFIDDKYKGRLQMPKIKITRWRLLEILFLDFDARFRYPIFEGIFTLDT